MMSNEQSSVGKGYRAAHVSYEQAGGIMKIMKCITPLVFAVRKYRFTHQQISQVKAGAEPAHTTQS